MSTNTFIKQKMTPEVKRGIVLWILKAVGGLVFFAALPFLSADYWDWVMEVNDGESKHHIRLSG